MSDTMRPAAPARPSRRRGFWIAAAVVVGLLVAVFAAGEAIARSVIQDRVDQAVRDAGVEASGPVSVDIPGLVLPQLIGGRIGEATASAQDVTVEGITADVTLDVRGLDVRGTTAESATAEASLDAPALEALLDRASAGSVWQELGSAARVAIAEPHVEVSGELPVLGIGLPVAMSLTPSAADGALMLAPESVAIGDWTLTRDDLDALPSGTPEAVARPIPVCLAEAIPRGIALDDVHIEGERVLAGFRIDGSILTDPVLRQPGDCA